MNSYHKIQGLYKRYTDNYPKKGKFIIGKYSKLEFELLKDIKWIWTEKIDGTNIRVIWKKHDLIFKGKTDRAEIPNHLLSKLQEIFTKEKMISVLEIEEGRPDICLYGEGYGYKIQSGGKYFKNPKDVNFILFDIKVGNIWLKRKDVEDIARQLNILVVPIIGEGTIDESIQYVKNSPKSFFGDFIMEGLVIRPKHELLDRRGYRIITKIKYKDFKNGGN